MSKSNISYSVDLLKAMDNYVKEVIGDEAIFEKWFTYGIPDGADYDELEEIAEDGHTTMFEVIKAFYSCVKADEKYNY